MICNDNSQYYMGLDDRDDVSSIGEMNGNMDSFQNATTEVTFTLLKNHKLKEPCLTSLHFMNYVEKWHSES